MKKFLLGLLIGLLIATPVAALATTNGAIRLIINGVDITPTMDVAPQIIDGRTMVPARYVAENLGATVKWDAATNSVMISSQEEQAQTETPEKTYRQNEAINLGNTEVKLLNTFTSTTRHEFTANANECFFVIEFEVKTSAKPTNGSYWQALSFFSQIGATDGTTFQSGSILSKDILSIYPDTATKVVVCVSIPQDKEIASVTLQNPDGKNKAKILLAK